METQQTVQQDVPDLKSERGQQAIAFVAEAAGNGAAGAAEPQGEAG